MTQLIQGLEPGKAWEEGKENVLFPLSDYRKSSQATGSLGFGIIHTWYSRPAPLPPSGAMGQHPQ